LEILDAAMSLDKLKALRSNRLEALKADCTGQYSIRINMQWRIAAQESGAEIGRLPMRSASGGKHPR